MKKWLVVVMVLCFTSVLMAEGLVVGSPEWNKQKKVLWDEYMKYKVAVDDTSHAPLDIQIETQQKKLMAADKLVEFGDRLPVVQGIAAWQYNNTGKLYINTFESYSGWSSIIKKLEATTDRATRKTLKAELYEKAKQHLTFLEQAAVYLEKAKELNLLSPDDTRTQKITNNLAYVNTVKAWLDSYKEE